MKRFTALTATLLIALTSSVWVSAAKLESGSPAPNFSAKDIKGETISLSDYKGKIVVLEWTNFECPFVRKHYDSTNMQTLQKRFTGEGVIWISICSSAEGKQGYESEKDLTRRLNVENAFPTVLIRDENGTIGRLYGAKTTPHMFVINQDGILAYQGAIDDNTSFNPEDVHGARSYIIEAIESVKQGYAPEPDETPSYGCSVKY